MVERINSSQHVEHDRLLTELFGWHGIMWAAQQPVLKQLSHLLHSIFISLPTSAEIHGPEGLQFISWSPVCSAGQV